MDNPKEEMFRFSHQVTTHLLPGEQGINSPIGCWEFDPTSTPSALLHVVTQVQRREREGTVDAIQEHLFSDIEKSKGKELDENAETDGMEMDAKMDDETNIAIKGMKKKLEHRCSLKGKQ